MIGKMPKFINSEYAYQDKSGKTLLRDDAPEELKKEFKEYWEIQESGYNYDS